MRCLCCGKILLEKEEKIGWHNACIKRFFGTENFPQMDISETVLMQLAKENTEKGLTVPGVQKKLSLHLTKEKQPRLTLVNYPTGYILKPQTNEYSALPESEFLIMQMARQTGIKTVPFGLVKMQNDDKNFAYITKRIDRVKTKNEKVDFLAMEDFCQLENRLTIDKYKGSYERCAKVISTYSEMPGLDLSELFLRIVFSYAIGNSDMHLKNFSLIETSVASAKYQLSDAYDMLPVNIIVLSDNEEMALTLNGKKNNLHRKDFLIFAESCQIPRKSAEKMIEKVVSMKETYLQMCETSYLPDNMKEKLALLIEARIGKLTK